MKDEKRIKYFYVSNVGIFISSYDDIRNNTDFLSVFLFYITDNASRVIYSRIQAKRLILENETRGIKKFKHLEYIIMRF